MTLALSAQRAIIRTFALPMKQFEIPSFYRSPLLSALKAKRKAEDPRKKSFEPSVLDFGAVRFHLGRHFGFCYGVENAIEIAYSTIENNPNRRIFMLSQMIHNPAVNADLNDRGLRFILDTEGGQITPWSEVHHGDIVIIPAFGTTLEIKQKLDDMGVETESYNTTCPFVEKVWKTAEKLGEQRFTIIIHGKFQHEETQATFSFSRSKSASVVVKDIDDARKLGRLILNPNEADQFYEMFKGKHSPDFDVKRDLERVGVINQTTMLASETHEIAEYFKGVMLEKFGNGAQHFADTRDTLCYATNDNQMSTYELLNVKAQMAIVVGGYNSSNTSHLHELCATKFESFFINGPGAIDNLGTITHFNYADKKFETKPNFLPEAPVDIVLTSGASCPDTVVEAVMDKILSFYPHALPKSGLLALN